MFAICRNQLFTYYRRQRRASIVIDLELNCTDNRARNDSDALAIRLAVRLLPMRQQNLYRLRYRQGLTIAQIAELFGVSEGTIKYRFYEMRVRLRRLLA